MRRYDIAKESYHHFIFRRLEVIPYGDHSHVDEE